MMAKIHAFIYVLKNAIEFYRYLVDTIDKACYMHQMSASKREFDILRDVTKSDIEKLEALKEIENEINKNCN